MTTMTYQQDFQARPAAIATWTLFTAALVMPATVAGQNANDVDVAETIKAVNSTLDHATAAVVDAVAGPAHDGSGQAFSGRSDDGTHGVDSWVIIAASVAAAVAMVAAILLMFSCFRRRRGDNGRSKRKGVRRSQSVTLDALSEDELAVAKDIEANIGKSTVDTTAVKGKRRSKSKAAMKADASRKASGSGSAQSDGNSLHDDLQLPEELVRRMSASKLEFFAMDAQGKKANPIYFTASRKQSEQVAALMQLLDDKAGPKKADDDDEQDNTLPSGGNRAEGLGELPAAPPAPTSRFKRPSIDSMGGPQSVPRPPRNNSTDASQKLDKLAEQSPYDDFISVRAAADAKRNEDGADDVYVDTITDSQGHQVTQDGHENVPKQAGTKALFPASHSREPSGDYVTVEGSAQQDSVGKKAGKRRGTRRFLRRNGGSGQAAGSAPAASAPDVRVELPTYHDIATMMRQDSTYYTIRNNLATRMEDDDEGINMLRTARKSSEGSYEEIDHPYHEIDMPYEPVDGPYEEMDGSYDKVDGGHASGDDKSYEDIDAPYCQIDDGDYERAEALGRSSRAEDGDNYTEVEASEPTDTMLRSLLSGDHEQIEDLLSQIPKIDANCIKLRQLVEEGSFGRSYTSDTIINGLRKRTSVLAVSSQITEPLLNATLQLASTLYSISHKNVLRFYGAARSSGKLKLVMELCEYGRLDHVLHKWGQLPVAAELVFARQIAAAMLHLEAKGIVHSNLRCRNVLVCPGGLLKLTGFGYDRGPEQAHHGSDLRWMAPELDASINATPFSDVWSFGVVLIELATQGEMPYSQMAWDDRRVHQQVQQGYRLSCPTSMAPDIYSLCLRCWQAQPHLRPRFNEVLFSLQVMSGVEEPEDDPVLNPDVHVFREVNFSEDGPTKEQRMLYALGDKSSSSSVLSDDWAKIVDEGASSAKPDGFASSLGSSAPVSANDDYIEAEASIHLPDPGSERSTLSRKIGSALRESLKKPGQNKMAALGYVKMDHVNVPKTIEEKPGYVPLDASSAGSGQVQKAKSSKARTGYLPMNLSEAEASQSDAKNGGRRPLSPKPPRRPTRRRVKDTPSTYEEDSGPAYMAMDDRIQPPPRSGRSSPRGPAPPVPTSPRPNRISSGASGKAKYDNDGGSQSDADDADPYEVPRALVDPEWVHGRISRVEAENLLLATDQGGGMPGAFLFRRKAGEGQYAISVLTDIGHFDHYLLTYEHKLGWYMNGEPTQRCGGPKDTVFGVCDNITHADGRWNLPLLHPVSCHKGLAKD